jgi:hypothetical protein
MSVREEYIKDFKTQLYLGILRHKSNGDIEAVDFASRQILGYYRAATNVTTDFFGRIITKGNTVVSLIYNKR